MRHIWSCAFAFALLMVPGASEAKTTVRFQPTSPTIGPFPTDVLTKTDSTQKTGLHVNLQSAPFCLGSPLVSCPAVKALLNQFDGFSVKPQIRICFSGPIDVTTVQNAVGIAPADGSQSSIGVDQILYDHNTSCVLAKPDHVLNQSTKYLLFVSNRIRDAAGKPVERDPAFKDCAKGGTSDYCNALSLALRQGPEEAQNVNVVGASLFTTMSATDWMEKARNFLYTSPVPPVILPAGPTSVFDVPALQSFVWLPQTNIGAPPSPSTAVPIPLQALQDVQKVAFGLYLSPNFLQISGPQAGTIAVTPTGGPIQPPVPVNDPALAAFPPGYLPLSYHVFLPATPSPTAKIPVVIFGHGFSDNQFGGPTAIASTLAKAGFATLAMEFVGHGFGPASVAALVDSSGQHFVSTPGRGIPLSPDGSIGAIDGCIVPGPLAVRDCFRQSAVDLMALVRNIGANGLGVNLDPSRIYYVGQSLGSFIGSVLHAVEPNVIGAVLNSGGDSPVDTARLRLADQLTDFYLLTYNGQLAATVGDAPTTDPAFDYFFPYRGQLTETVVAGHGDIQTALEVADWMHVPGAPMAYAPHFEVQPLPGVPRKETLFQFSFGDLEVPNPVQSALVRAAVAIDQNPDAPLPIEYLRFDLAVAADPHLANIFMPGLPFSILPHRLLANTTLLDPANADELVLTLEVQRQIVNFFKFGAVGPTLPLFENLTLSTLPDGRNFTWPFQLAPGS